MQRDDVIHWGLVGLVTAGFIAGAAFAAGAFEDDETNPFTAQVETRCGSDVTDWRHISWGDFYVHEMADGTYAIHENSWPNATQPRPHRTECDVGEEYWDDPDSWVFTGE